MTIQEQAEAMELCRLYGPNNCWTGGTGRMAALLFKALEEINKTKRQDLEKKKWGPMDYLVVQMKPDKAFD
jgi:hypothetical protein